MHFNTMNSAKSVALLKDLPEIGVEYVLDRKSPPGKRAKRLAFLRDSLEIGAQYDVERKSKV